MVENSRSLSHKKVTLPKNGPYSKFFWSVFCRIQTEQGEIQSISLSVFSSNTGKHGSKNSE